MRARFTSPMNGTASRASLAAALIRLPHGPKDRTPPVRTDENSRVRSKGWRNTPMLGIPRPWAVW